MPFSLALYLYDKYKNNVNEKFEKKYRAITLDDIKDLLARADKKKTLKTNPEGI